MMAKRNAHSGISALIVSGMALLAAACLASGCAKKGSAAAAPVSNAYYSPKAVARGVWRIDEHGSVNMYLVAGNDKAALIDTGEGEPGLDEVVRSLTSLPVIVVNTHGHGDHAGGNPWFDSIYAHPADMDAVRSMSSPKSRFFEIKRGDSIDLGGRSLKVIETPGHTRGSVCLLDPADRILFSGDNNNGHVWLFLGDSLSVEEYLASLERLMARSTEFDLILPGHGDACDASRLSRIAESCRAVLGGTAQERPYQNHMGALCYGPGDALVAYSPRRIFAPK